MTLRSAYPQARSRSARQHLTRIHLFLDHNQKYATCFVTLSNPLLFLSRVSRVTCHVVSILYLEPPLEAIYGYCATFNTN
jgi:hypothetical protein